MANLEKARAEFENVLEYLVDKLPELKVTDVDKEGFAGIALRISDSRLKGMFCEAAIGLLQENILQHLATPPRLKELRSAEARRQLREWRETLVMWESALQGVRSASEA